MPCLKQTHNNTMWHGFVNPAVEDRIRYHSNDCAFIAGTYAIFQNKRSYTTIVVNTI